MELVYLESQSVNGAYVLKAVVPYWLFVPMNAAEGLIRFRDWSLPRRAIAQANHDGVNVTSRPMCVSV